MAAQRTHMRRNPDVESSQEVFDPEILIRRANRLQRLVKNIFFPAEGVIFACDTSEHCNQGMGLTLHRNKYKSTLSDLVVESSAFYFPCISWTPLTS